MNYQESMSGLDQVFNALFEQQQRPVQTQVDEMQTANSEGGMNDLMQQLKAIGQGQQPSGIDLMNENFSQGVDDDKGGGWLSKIVGLFT